MVMALNAKADFINVETSEVNMHKKKHKWLNNEIR